MSDSTTMNGGSSGGRISIADTLSRTFAVLFVNAVPFLILSLVLSTPLLLYRVFSGGVDAITSPSDVGPAILIVLLLNIIVGYLVMGALVFGTIRELRGSRATIGECLSGGLSVLIPVIVVGLLVFVLVVAGLFLIVVPGIMVFVICAVAVPAAVVERPGIWASIKRSAELTKGNRWRVFALIVIAYVGFSVAGYILDLIGVPVWSLGGSGFAFLIQYVWSAITTAVFAVLGAVMYHDLRVAKEGVDTEQIAAVFD